MMNSSFDEEDDPFGPNPFRSSGDADLLGAPAPAPAPPRSSGIMMDQPLNQPDPQSGMMGSFELPPPTPPAQQQQQQQQPQFAPQQQTLSGSMDQRAANNYGGTSDEVRSTPFGRFGWRSCVACFRLDSYRQYFDMDTLDILKRLRASLTSFWLPDHFRTAIVGEAGSDDFKGPDLYGPLWISMTLIFLIAVTSNLHAYMDHARRSKNSDEDIEEFEYDIHHLLRAGSVVFCFVFIIPTILWLGTTCLAMSSIDWALWICCFGYSQVPYLVATLIVWIPVQFWEWIVLAIATAASCLLVVRNLSTPLLGQDTSSNHATAASLVMAILGCYFIYLFVLKFTFYK